MTNVWKVFLMVTQQIQNILFSKAWQFQNLLVLFSHGKFKNFISQVTTIFVNIFTCHMANVVLFCFFLKKHVLYTWQFLFNTSSQVLLDFVLLNVTATPSFSLLANLDIDHGNSNFISSENVDSCPLLNNGKLRAVLR